MSVQVIATLSNGETQATATFKVKYLAEVIQEEEPVEINQAPYFLIQPQSVYVRFIDANNTDQVDPVVLGKANDLEGDSISHKLLC